MTPLLLYNYFFYCVRPILLAEELFILQLFFKSRCFAEFAFACDPMFSSFWISQGLPISNSRAILNSALPASCIVGRFLGLINPKTYFILTDNYMDKFIMV